MRYLVWLAVTCISLSHAYAQDFTNIRVAQEGTKLVVTYDLVSADPNATFTVALYSSHNNFASPVLTVTGAVGKGQKPGANMRMEWDLRTDLQTFHGQLSVELGGVPEVVKLDFRKPFLSKTVKQGKDVTISWQGGTRHPNVKLDIYRDGKLVSSLGEKKNTGSFQWSVPPDIEKGDGFTFRISSGDEHAVSAPFAIKSKMPLWLIIAVPTVAVGATITIIILGGKLPDAPPPS